jgi:hypothetical protein
MTSASPRDDARRRELAAIHAAKKQLGLDDDTYRDLVFGVTGKRSAGDLDGLERQKLIEHLRALGFAPAAKGAASCSAPRSVFVYHDRREHRLIAALWRNLWLLGETEDPGARALDKFVQRQAGVAALKWLAPEAAHSVVQALKDWLARAGFQTPSSGAKDVKKLALTRLVKAQWARLESLGAVAFEDANHRENALDAYFDKYCSPCKKGVGHPMTTPAELDALAARLGAWIRTVRKSPGGES